jgi:cytochrome d ubiquinol oxidase subunit I
MIFSLIALGAVYLALLVVELTLLVRYVRAGVAGAMPELAAPDDHDDPDPRRDDVLAFAY